MKIIKIDKEEVELMIKTCEHFNPSASASPVFITTKINQISNNIRIAKILDNHLVRFPQNFGKTIFYITPTEYKEIQDFMQNPYQTLIANPIPITHHVVNPILELQVGET